MSNLTRRVRISLVGLAALALAVAGLPGQAQVVLQLTDTTSDSFGPFAAIDDAGTSVYTNVSADQFGGNPQHAFQLVEYDAVSGSGSNVALFAQGITGVIRDGVSVSDDGVWLAFISNGDLAGQNHDRSDEIFVIQSNGTQLSQVTNDPGPAAGSVLAMFLAGNGNKIFFASAYNPLGTNAGLDRQLFAINRDGTGLAQLTTLSQSDITYIGVSDDATRVVFTSDGDPLGTNTDENTELFAINGDGTNLRQLTTTTASGMEAPAIAGNGATIVFHSSGDHLGLNPGPFPEVFAIEWDGTNFRQLTQSTDPFGSPAITSYPSITDDAQTVYFSSNQGDFPFPPGGDNPDGSIEIWKINANGTGETAVTNFVGGQNYYQMVSGNGNRMSFLRYGDPCDGTAGPNDVYQLCVGDTSGGGISQLTVSTTGNSFEPDVKPDGSQVVFGSTADPTGGDPDNVGQIYLVDRDGSNLTQLTSFTTGFYSRTPSIADNGTVVFLNNNNDDALNPSLTQHVTRVFSNGTGVLRLTAGATQESYLPVISSDGSTVLFSSYNDFTGGNADNSFEVFKVNSDGTGMTQLTFDSDPAGEAAYARVDAAGNWVVFAANGDPTGGNPDGSVEVFRIRTDGTALQQITDYPSSEGSAIYPDISGAGDLFVMMLNFDFGNNPDHGYDLYSWDATNGLVQLTAMDGDAYQPRLSDDGAYVYFVSDGSFTETDPDDMRHAYRLEMSSGTVERIDGLAFGALGYPYPPNYYVATDDDGDVAAFAVAGDFTEGNRDRDPEVFAIDLSRPALTTISGGPAPTQYDWEVEAGPIRYDAIRGDVANLAPGAPGEIDLGTVICLEEDRPTPGAEDAVTPAVGQAFFYLRRGSQGVTTGPGSYGEASDGSERIAGSGGCAG